MDYVGLLWGKIFKMRKGSQDESCKPLILLVPRDRIELPTRGFSDLGVINSR